MRYILLQNSLTKSAHNAWSTLARGDRLHYSSWWHSLNEPLSKCASREQGMRSVHKSAANRQDGARR